MRNYRDFSSVCKGYEVIVKNRMGSHLKLEFGSYVSQFESRLLR